ncbi:PlaO5 [Streptomyces sp. Tu6071]|uniref:cytochrome P450 n=1 Tax=Streptomyces sp. Tu6071 TaxID=355249 RepID=UPI000068F3AE|nr:cytochrome P450 [Streptomyces sp. Tu6071]ABB69764.1 PlaO5 [Streptomyces sp. Tu6071]EGJ74217.1 PlaO5 [Streptomyces sp. Tu6071]
MTESLETTSPDPTRSGNSDTGATPGYTVPKQVNDMWREKPVRRFSMRDGREAWLVTGRAEVRTVLADPRFSRVEARRLDAVMSPAVIFTRPGILDMDPPEHTRLRRLVAGEFSARRMRALRPRIQQIADELIGTMKAAGPPADLAEGLSYPLPIAVICEILGVPYADRERFRAWADRVSAPGTQPQEAMAALRSLFDYMGGLVDDKHAHPDGSLLHGLVTARDEQGRLDNEELVTLGCGLLLAGYETTATMLGKGLLALLDNPDQLAVVRSDPRAVPAAVSEVLRHVTPGVDPHTGLIRATTADVELGGTVIPAHSVVVACNTAANFDPATFRDPDRFDVTRENAAAHLTFGHGMHRCVGAQLAQIELEAAFAALFPAIPGLRLAVPADEITYTQSTLIRGLRSLPVLW